MAEPHTLHHALQFRMQQSGELAAMLVAAIVRQTQRLT
jgi:hypothetical protein